MSMFYGQVAVVTGASSGVGKAVALGLAAQGATVCLVGRKRATLEQAATSACDSASRFLLYQVDLMEDAEIREFEACLRRDVRAVDILVHSAGVLTHGRVEAAGVEDFDRQYRINVRAPYLLTQVLLPPLKEQRGQIVFINSSVGISARANISQYAATKYALKALADSLRDEVNADGVRVLSMFLGRTATPMQAAVYAAEGRPYHPELLLQPEDVAAVILHALSLPRTAEVTEVSMRPLVRSY